MQANGIITLTTDFGTRDIFVGVLKGVILQIHPRATIVDITHDLPPHDIRAASFLIHAASRHFPPGSVHLVVVDPGVGSDRQAIAVAARDHFFVAPDNGVLSDVIATESRIEAVAIDAVKFGRHPLSNTFHGRDLFAPVAARLANGFPLRYLGAQLGAPLRIPGTNPEIVQDRIRGQVQWIDRFGNAITNIDRGTFEAGCGNCAYTICVGALRLTGLSDRYCRCQPGEPLAIFNSFDLLEIAAYHDSAAEIFAIRSGSAIEIQLQ